MKIFSNLYILEHGDKSMNKNEKLDELRFNREHRFLRVWETRYN